MRVFLLSQPTEVNEHFIYCIEIDGGFFPFTFFTVHFVEHFEKKVLWVCSFYVFNFQRNMHGSRQFRFPKRKKLFCLEVGKTSYNFFLEKEEELIR